MHYFDPDGRAAAEFGLTLWGASQAQGLGLAALSGPVGWAIGAGVILIAVVAWKAPEISQKINSWMDHKENNQSLGNQTINSNRDSSNSSQNPNDKKKEKKVISEKKLKPDEKAIGSHTVYRIDPRTGKVIKYETYQPQTNSYDPKAWKSVKRYDGPGSDPHYNKVLEQYVDAPHIHESYCPGGVRPALPIEIPK